MNLSRSERLNRIAAYALFGVLVLEVLFSHELFRLLTGAMP